MTQTTTATASPTNPTPVEATIDKLFQDFNTVVVETEQLLRSLAGSGGDKAVALKASVEQGLAAAGERLEKIRDASLSQARTAARATNEYVQDNPWRAVGIVAAAGAIAGLIAGLLIGRR